MRQTQKRWSAMLLIMLVVVVLSACGKPAAEGGTQQEGADKQATEQARTITHMKGERVFEKAPERIVVLDTQYLDQLTALGQRVAGSAVATNEATPFPAYLVDKIGDVTQIGSSSGVNLEAVLALNPDVIICTEFQNEIYDALDKIAPTLMFERNEDWQKTIVTLGQLLHKEKKAEQVINDYNKKVASLKADLAKKMGDETVAMIRPRDKQIRIHTTAHRTSQILYQDLGLKAPAMVLDDKNTSAMINLEVMPELNADHLFVLTDNQYQQLTEEFAQTAVWKSLKPVQNKQVNTVKTTTWIVYYGPLAINRIVDEIAASLLP